MKVLAKCRGFHFFYIKNFLNLLSELFFIMSAESQIITGKLKGHIEQIISKYEIALSDNISLKGQLERALKELAIKNDRIKELEQKVEQMQLADAFTASTDDVKEAKKRIGKIVREIDKCISMLND